MSTTAPKLDRLHKIIADTLMCHFDFVWELVDTFGNCGNSSFGSRGAGRATNTSKDASRRAEWACKGTISQDCYSLRYLALKWPERVLYFVFAHVFIAQILGWSSRSVWLKLPLNCLLIHSKTIPRLKIKPSTLQTACHVETRKQSAQNPKYIASLCTNNT